MLANIYLHTVLDEWFENEVKPRLGRDARLFRYADDAVVVFANEADARKVYEVLPKRFAKYGLALHPEKTRLFEFRRPTDKDEGDAKRATFDLLGLPITGESRCAASGSSSVRQRRTASNER